MPILHRRSVLKRSPSDDEWKSVLADAQVKLGTAQSLLLGPRDSAAIAKTGVAARIGNQGPGCTENSAPGGRRIPHR
jgi:hypothetical protein